MNFLMLLLLSIACRKMEIRRSTMSITIPLGSIHLLEQFAKRPFLLWISKGRCVDRPLTFICCCNTISVMCSQVIASQIGPVAIPSTDTVSDCTMAAHIRKNSPSHCLIFRLENWCKKSRSNCAASTCCSLQGLMGILLVWEHQGFCWKCDCNFKRPEYEKSMWCKKFSLSGNTDLHPWPSLCIELANLVPDLLGEESSASLVFVSLHASLPPSVIACSGCMTAVAEVRYQPYVNVTLRNYGREMRFQSFETPVQIQTLH